LSDYDVSKESGLKRLKKSTTRALEHFEEITDSGDYPGLFVTVESAWFSAKGDDGKMTLAKILEKSDQIGGFGLHGVSQTPQKIVSKEEKKETVVVKEVDLPLVQKVISTLPQGKPRYVPGPFRLSQIVELVRSGVDLFDSSIVTKMADAGEVFILDPLVKSGFVIISGMKGVNEDLPKRGDSVKMESLDDHESTRGATVSVKDKRYLSNSEWIGFNYFILNC
jgi:tRNA-guanine family transglycosylase